MSKAKDFRLRSRDHYRTKGSAWMANQGSFHPFELWVCANPDGTWHTGIFDLRFNDFDDRQLVEIRNDHKSAVDAMAYAVNYAVKNGAKDPTMDWSSQ